MNEYKEIKAPNRLNSYSIGDLNRTVFLAGSITGAVDWQKDAAALLTPYFGVFNPRRDNYDKLDRDVEREQMTWEFLHLDLATITLFYFAPETLAPITLFEYGKQLSKMKYEPFRKTYICVHPNYQRKNDIWIQTELAQPQLLKNFHPTVTAMCEAIIKENT